MKAVYESVGPVIGFLVLALGWGFLGWVAYTMVRQFVLESGDFFSILAFRMTPETPEFDEVTFMIFLSLIAVPFAFAAALLWPVIAVIALIYIGALVARWMRRRAFARGVSKEET